MPRLPFRIAMFLSSYAPLFALLAYENRSVPWAWLTLALVAALSIIALGTVLATLSHERGPRLRVVNATPKDGEVLAYIASYLVPFFDLDLRQIDHAVALFGFLLILGIVYINSSMLFVNPLLSLVRYHTYDIEDDNGEHYSLLTQRLDLTKGTRIRPVAVTTFVRVEAWRAQRVAQGFQSEELGGTGDDSGRISA